MLRNRTFNKLLDVANIRTCRFFPSHWPDLPAYGGVVSIPKTSVRTRTPCDGFLHRTGGIQWHEDDPLLERREGQMGNVGLWRKDLSSNISESTWRAHQDSNLGPVSRDSMALRRVCVESARVARPTQQVIRMRRAAS